MVVKGQSRGVLLVERRQYLMHGSTVLPSPLHARSLGGVDVWEACFVPRTRYTTSGTLRGSWWHRTCSGRKISECLFFGVQHLANTRRVRVFPATGAGVLIVNHSRFFFF